MRAFITICLIFSYLFVFSQSSKDSLLKEYIGKTKEQLQLQNYSTADQYLKKIFSLKTTVPDEVAFLFGKTQLGLKNYVKARDAFKKYLDLSRNKGEYSAEAEKLIAEAEKYICRKCDNTGIARIRDTCDFCKGKGIYFTECQVCRGKGRQICFVCSGNGVTAKSGPFGMIYSNCTKCDGKGVTECASCKGSGKQEKYCETCRGKGFLQRDEPCNHRP